MSDSSSLSSSSSGSMDLQDDWLNGRPRHFSRGSLSSTGDGTPSRESVGAALDRYMAASREGRLAFSGGKLKAAVLEFDQALNIELQTELECLYDTSIGFVSGLVRREVESRLEQQGGSGSLQAETKCDRILQQLRSHYEDGASGLLKGKAKGSAKWYLQMGAALVVINEWEKAKAIYTEGLSTCRDKKELKLALKNLIKIEQMTSYGDIPAEDQPDKKQPAVSLIKPSPTPSPSCSPAHSPRTNKRVRGRASSFGWLKDGHAKRERTSSLTLDTDSKSQYQLSVKPFNSPQTNKKENKRLSLSIFRRSSDSFLQNEEEIRAWSSCFEPTSCVVIGQTDFQPSAITHMRKLTSLKRKDMNSSEDATDQKLNLTFTPINQESLRIADDDSELEDLED